MRATISVDGQPVEFHSPRDAIDAGIGMVHQHFRLVEPFTVAENIVLGEHGRFRRRRRRASRVRELGERYGLAGRSVGPHLAAVGRASSSGSRSSRPWPARPAS